MSNPRTEVMPLVISCSTCSKQLRLPETLLGQLVCCPGCQTEFTVRDDQGRISVQRSAALADPAPLPGPPGAEEIPVVRPAPRPAGDRPGPAAAPPAAAGAKDFKPFTFIVAVVWDPERRLRGELLARVSPYGLQLRDRNDQEYHMPVGSRARYMGGNRFMVDLGTRDLTLRVAKRNCNQTKLARHTVAFLTRQRSTLREADYLSAGLVRWLALVPMLAVALFFLPRGGSGLGIFVVLGVTLAVGLVNFLILRSTRLSLGLRLGANFGLWALIGAGVMPLTYVLVRHINATVAPPRLVFRTFGSQDGSWSAMLPERPRYTYKYAAVVGGNSFSVATVDLPWDRATFEIWHAQVHQVNNGGMLAGAEEQVFSNASQDVLNSDYTWRLVNSTANVRPNNNPNNTKIKGKEFLFENSSGVKLKMRVYIAGNHIYIARVRWRGNLPNSDIDLFFNNLIPTGGQPFNPGGGGVVPGWSPEVPIGLRKVWPPREVSNDVMLHWDFEEEPGDARCLDQSDNHWNGQLVGGDRIVNGVVGKAVHLERTKKAHIDFSDPNAAPNFGHRKSWTIAFWLATTENRNGTVLSMRPELGNALASIKVEVQNGLLLSRVVDDTGRQGFGNLQSARQVNDGAWHHVALVRDENSLIKLYLDGVLQGQLNVVNTADGPITTRVRALGCDLVDVRLDEQQFLDPTLRFFDCCVDEFCIFGKALSNDDIRKLSGRW
jgi:hypothetical protein